MLHNYVLTVLVFYFAFIIVCESELTQKGIGKKFKDLQKQYENSAGSHDNEVVERSEQENETNEEVIQENEADESTIQENEADESTIRENEADESTIQENEADESTIQENETDESTIQENEADEDIRQETETYEGMEQEKKTLSSKGGSGCWMFLNAEKHIKFMEDLEIQYAAAIDRFIEAIEKDNLRFSKDLLAELLASRGRISYGQSPYDIPAGLNLGGYSMLRMPESLLFFHRIKLRNDTRFRIDKLDTELYNMRLTAHLSLNDLHLIGNYERALTDLRDPSILYYTPTYGQVEILLKNVKYLVEGRVRLLKDCPYLVLIGSEIRFDESLMIYQNNATSSKPIALSNSNIEELTDRLKSDLDEWLKDYFNEHLVLYTKIGRAIDQEYREYLNKRIAVLNKYVEDTLVLIKDKLNQLNASAVELPNFSIFSVNRVELKLTNGVLRGLDSIYRRSVATGDIEGYIRKVDAIVGFSNLKVTYTYTAVLGTGLPPLTGLLALSADELTAHMGLSLLTNPEAVDLDLSSIRSPTPKSLTVEGPANRMIANFKHLLDHHVGAIMTNGLIHNIRAMNSLVKCQPKFFPHTELKDLTGKHRLIFYNTTPYSE